MTCECCEQVTATVFVVEPDHGDGPVVFEVCHHCAELLVDDLEPDAADPEPLTPVLPIPRQIPLLRRLSTLSLRN